MAATFGNLDLESLGVVGEPSVEYAKFETKVSEPDGYDGGVLANFRRGATKIKFNLAMDGTRAEIVAKMSQLAAELGKGQQELVLPNMTQGFHFDASANCALQPVEYVDGFVLPLEFVVPDGLAWGPTKTANIPAWNWGDDPYMLTLGGLTAPRMRISGEMRMPLGDGSYVGISLLEDSNLVYRAKSYVRFGGLTSLHEGDYTLVMSIDISTMSASRSITPELDIDPFSLGAMGFPLMPGDHAIYSTHTYDSEGVPDVTVVEWEESGVW